MKRVIARIATESPESTNKSRNITAKDFLRYSISLFVVGIVFLIMSIYVGYTPNQQSPALEIISAVFMALAIIFFPYVDRKHKDKIPMYMLKILGYIFLVLITAISIMALIPISNLTIEFKSNTIYMCFVLWGILSACLLYIILNVTIRTLIAITSYISSKIKYTSNKDNELITNIKKAFACIGAIAGFIVSILTIVLGVLEIIQKIG